MHSSLALIGRHFTTCTTIFFCWIGTKVLLYYILRSYIWIIRGSNSLNSINLLPKWTLLVWDVFYIRLHWWFSSNNSYYCSFEFLHCVPESTYSICLHAWCFICGSSNDVKITWCTLLYAHYLCHHGCWEPIKYITEDSSRSIVLECEHISWYFWELPLSIL